MITVKEIAEIAGVSMTTVYNVLHGNTKKVSQANIQKIKKILEENHYVPRMGLSGLKNGSSKIIGVVIHVSRHYENTVIADSFYSHVIGVLEKNIREAGYYMMLYAAEDLDDIFKMALAWNVDGLIAITFTHNDYVKIRTLTGKPIVAIDLIDKFNDDFVNVGLEDEQGGYIMTKYLIECGYTNILMFANKDAGVDHQRWLGYRRALEEGGIPYKPYNFTILEDSFEMRLHNYEGLMKFVNKNAALFFASDTFALEAMRYFQTKGIQIPDEIAIAGFDDSLLAQYAIPRLTTIHQDITDKAEVAVSLMLDMIAGKLVGNIDVKRPVWLIKGRSVKVINNKNNKDR